ncbi:hypothetical protein [Oxynema aestuarii]|uniref:Uncharacterized protein n=1 Tax=Oxynema aestuarii AP17 TaxID=2064643 RepID=A0A6H1TTU8_9CYAN|nr:hypothetical protein [Oxynema aestuarii]QIZ69636.1 hypothetical protein HCG48_02760 [Oxynema aestuarii AP17]
MNSPLTVPENVSFAEAIAVTEQLMEAIATGNIDQSEIETRVRDLVASRDGARGFFVAYLTDSRPQSDRPSPEICRALSSSEEIVGELLAKNISMSAAMVLTHQRQNHPEMAVDSAKVRDRSARLIRCLNSSVLRENCRQMLESARTGEGIYRSFLEKWGYDDEQRQAIVTALEGAIAAP